MSDRWNVVVVIFSGILPLIAGLLVLTDFMFPHLISERLISSKLNPAEAPVSIQGKVQVKPEGNGITTWDVVDDSKDDVMICTETDNTWRCYNGEGKKAPALIVGGAVIPRIPAEAPESPSIGQVTTGSPPSLTVGTIQAQVITAEIASIRREQAQAIKSLEREIDGAISLMQFVIGGIAVSIIGLAFAVVKGKPE